MFATSTVNNSDGRCCNYDSDVGRSPRPPARQQIRWMAEVEGQIDETTSCDEEDILVKHDKQGNLVYSSNYNEDFPPFPTLTDDVPKGKLVFNSRSRTNND